MEKEKIGFEKKSLKKSPVFLTGLLTLILIVVYVFTLKNYQPAQNIIISGGIIVYPLTFLIVALISKYYGFKEARKSIFISSALYLVFMLLIMLAVFPHADAQTSGYNAILQYVFTNNAIEIGSSGYQLFYPTLGQFFGVVVAFVISHLIYATIYNAIHNFTIEYLSVGLSLFIAYVLDRMIFMPILYAKGLIKGNNTFEFLIQCLTSEFIAAIMMIVFIVIIYVIITSIKKTTKEI